MTSHTHPADPHATIDTPGATHDPVCNHWVIPERAHASATHEGVTIHFCSEGCARAFARTPAKFFARYQAR